MFLKIVIFLICDSIITYKEKLITVENNFVFSGKGTN